MVAEMARRLETTLVAGSPNRISAEQMQSWVVAYLRDKDEDLAQFPRLVGKPHWNLWMMDLRLEDALFVVLIFRTDGLEFFCGTGNAFEVKSFAESDSPDNADALLGMMTDRFSFPEGSVRFDRLAAEDWLERSW